jgi:hypothetical protein
MATVPPARRVQIVDETVLTLTASWKARQSRSPSAVLDILVRLGEPEDVARRALGDERALIEARRRRWVSVIALVFVGIGVLGCAGALLLASSGG